MLKQIIGQTPGGSRTDAPATLGASPLSSSTASTTTPNSNRPSSNNFTMTSSKNVLSNDVEIKGSIRFSHDLIIDGKIEGEVQSDGSLTVGENSLIKGEIKTRAVTIFGKVEGNITVAERCELKSNAILIGDVTAGTLSIEEGATFLGRSQVGKGAKAAAAATGSASATKSQTAA